MEEKKRVIFGKSNILLVGVMILLLIVTVSFTGCGDSSDSEEDNNSAWPTSGLAKMLPEPTSGDLEVITNDEEEFDFEVNNVSENDGNEYTEACKEKGYTIDAETSSSYEAYNEEGYKVTIYNYSDSFTVDLDAPIKMEEIDWNDMDAFKLLPKPKSTTGEVKWDNSNSALVFLGNVSFKDYKKYVKACKKAGFRKDYDKGETWYYADHKRKRKHLSLNYEGFNIMRVEISTPSDESSDEDDEDIDDEDEDYDEDVDDEEESSSSSVSSDFKETMDDYEKFMGKYVKFMKKYNNSDDPSDMLDDYNDLMDDYYDWSDKIDDIDTDELSTADYKYYTKVVNRVTKKLSGVL